VKVDDTWTTPSDLSGGMILIVARLYKRKD
jgi:hypothetical protein